MIWSTESCYKCNVEICVLRTDANKDALGVCSKCDTQPTVVVAPPKCTHLGMRPADQHKDLPCAWPACPEGHDHAHFYIPVPPDLSIFRPVTNRAPPMEPNRQLTYKRVTYFLDPYARAVRSDLPDTLHRWCLVE